jgi:hypothetical protein
MNPFRGFADCKNIFREAIEVSIIGIASNFIEQVSKSRSIQGTRYICKKNSASYYWSDERNNAYIRCTIDAEIQRDKYYVEMEIQSTPGLPCLFMVIFTIVENDSPKLYGIFHKGENPPNAIIQGIYGRLVDHTDALDYKDLDYV